MKKSKLIFLLLMPIIILVCAIFAQVVTEQLWPPRIRICEHCGGEGRHWTDGKELIECRWCEGEGGFAESSVEPWVFFGVLAFMVIPTVMASGVLTGAWGFKFFNIEITKNNTVKIEHPKGKANGKNKPD